METVLEKIGLEGRVARHKTAMTRQTFSRPVSLALQHGLIGDSRTFFDYGCGKGQDVRLLKARGIDSSGWDPHYFPDSPVVEADVVNLGYVLNVIENPDERLETLRSAFKLARRLLIVSVRTDRAEFTNRFWGDGFLTSHGAFQKIYSQEEFRVLLESTLGLKPYMASIGVAYLFKDEGDEALFHSERVCSSIVRSERLLLSQLRVDPKVDDVVNLVEQLGRIPSKTECPSIEILEQQLGSSVLLRRLLHEKINQEKFAKSQRERRRQIAAALALLWLNKQKFPPLSNLDPALAVDVAALWSTYKSACIDATSLLYSVGKPGLIANVARSCKFGKLVGDDFYIHVSALSAAPPELQIINACGELLVGNLPCDLLKFKLNGRAISYLFYNDFDATPHPELLHSIRVDLQTGKSAARDYSGANPPILHRKELFVLLEHPKREEYRALSEAEEKAELLSRPDIGFKKAWEALLNERGLQIESGTLTSIVTPVN